MRAAAPATVRSLPGFRQLNGRQLFVMEYRAAAATPADAVLVVPPFGEEMNRSRRMMHLLGHRLAALGLRAVQPDLAGTGDSDGAFGACDWQTWLDDLAAVATGVLEDSAIVATVGIRLGALMALAVSEHLPAGRLILWEPIADGGTQVEDLMRQRVMADRFRNRGSATTVAALRDELDRAGCVTLGGYELGRPLAHSLGAVTFDGLLARSRGPVSILRVGARLAADGMAPASGHPPEFAVPGPRFWASVETTTAPALLDITERLIDG